jgi:GMP synthase-like glutamine amidotransferase
MKLGILNADYLKPEFVAQFGEYPDMFSRRLHRFDRLIDLVTYQVKEQQYPANIDEVDAYLITGSKSSVYDDEPWIHRLAEFVRQLHAAKKPLVGICFGHQMVAHALGGRVEKAQQGWCAGIYEATLVKQAEEEGFNGEVYRLLASHQDQIVQLCEGGRVLASTPVCPVAMMLVDDHVLTFQAHPELETEFARQVFTMRRDILGEDLYQQAMASLEQSADHDLVIRWILSFLKKRI